MQYYNLKLVVIPKKDIKNEEAYEKISKLISNAMLKDEELKQTHEKNEYKNYVFCNLYPIQKSGIYTAGNMYTFDIRFINLLMAMKMKQFLSLIHNEDFKIVMSNLETNSQRKINKLITLTPAVITTDKGDYKIDNNIQLVKERILANTQKKYNQIYNEKIDVDFIDEIKQTNLKPIKIPYKNIYMLGNKFEITIKEDEVSQNLAYLALSIGLLEKNSIGLGFCRAI